MRLASAKVEGLTSRDGSASLRYVTTEGHPDLGSFYDFEIQWPNAKDGKIIGRVISGSTTNIEAYKHYLKQGIDILDWNMDWKDKGKYRDLYIEKYGKKYNIKDIIISNYEPKKHEIIQIRNILMNLYYRYNSSFEFNNSDTDANPKGYYNDTFYFVPRNLNSEFYKTMTAPESASHD